MPPPTAGGQGCLLGELADHGGDVGDSRAQVSVGAKVEDLDLLGEDPYPPVGTLRRWRGRTLRPALSAKHSRTRSTFRPLTLQSTVTYRTWGPSDGCTVQLRCGQPPDVVVPAEWDILVSMHCNPGVTFQVRRSGGHRHPQAALVSKHHP